MKVPLIRGSHLTGVYFTEFGIFQNEGLVETTKHPGREGAVNSFKNYRKKFLKTENFKSIGTAVKRISKNYILGDGTHPLLLTVMKISS